MNHHKQLWVLGILAAGMLMFHPAAAVENPQQPTLVKSYHLGKKPGATRLLIQLNQEASYRLLRDDSRVVVLIRKAALSPNINRKRLGTVVLDQIQVQEVGHSVKFSITLKDPKTRLSHFTNYKTSQIVIDLKNKAARKPPVVKEQRPQVAAKPVARKPAARQPAFSKPVARKPAPAKSPKGVPAPAPLSTDTRDIMQADQETKLKSGWKDYQKALKLYQSKRYPAALKAFEQFRRQYRESPYLANVAYLSAEAEYNLVKEDPFPNFEKALAAYQFAMRMYPGSQFYDHALFKAATIFEGMGYTLEARTLYERGLAGKKESRYTLAREAGKAYMLVREDKLEDAYQSFQIILRRAPQNPRAKTGLFQIAQRYYEKRNYAQALKIFEDVIRRWPEELSEQPEINYYVGEIYFNRKKFQEARRYYFNLVNLAPESARAHQGLNRIGDSYLLEDNGMAALTVFHRSSQFQAPSAEAQYAQIRLADIGIRYPTLRVKDLMLDAEPYYHPYQTYQQIRDNPLSREILAEATFSLGSAYYREQNYLKAIEQFKRLIPLDPESKFHRWSRNFIKQSMIHLIDQYSRQKGHLPLLYAYADYLQLGIGELDHLQSQLQIGESYQAIGLNSEALKFFEKVKFADTNRAYTGRLFLNLGQLHLSENKFKEAERVAKTFISNYAGNPRLPEARIILARAHQGQQRYDQSLAILSGLLDSPKIEKARIHSLMAEIWFAKGDLRNAGRAYRKTLDAYDRSIRHPPEYVQDAYYKLGMVLYMQGQHTRSLDALLAGRKLFPDHELRSWGDYLIVDNLDRLNKKDRAETELKNMVAQNRDGLILKAAESHLKVLDWEKRLKELL